MRKQLGSTKTVQDLQSEINQALEYLHSNRGQLPAPLKPLQYLETVVDLADFGRGSKGRQVKPKDSILKWSRGELRARIRIRSRPAGEIDDARLEVADRVHPAAPSELTRHQDPVRQLLLALAKAERDPQLGFVALKWFRDTYLPRQDVIWADTPENRQRILVEAINRRWIVTSKIPNPKNPRYPVTAIKINRPLPEVRQLLEQEECLRTTFAPITIAGERLSATVLRERR